MLTARQASHLLPLLWDTVWRARRHRYLVMRASEWATEESEPDYGGAAAKRSTMTILSLMATTASGTGEAMSDDHSEGLQEHQYRILVWLSSLICVCIALVMPSDGVGAQAAGGRMVSEGGVPCASCVLTFGEATVIGDRDDHFLDTAPFDYATTSRGHVIVVTMSQVQEFDRSGNFVRRLGRTGDGPGEFRNPTGIVVGPADTVFIFHGAGVEVFDTHGTPVRQALAPRALRRPIQLATGEFVQVRDPGGPVGSPSIHVYSSDKEPRAFGPGTVPGNSPGRTAVQRLELAPSSDGSFWLAPRAPYRLERWTAAGHLQLVLERQSAHHPHAAYERVYEGGRFVRQTMPYLSAVGEDREGRVWTAVVRELGAGESAASRFESVIEILDPRTGNLVATGQVPGAVARISQDGYLVILGVGEPVVPLLHVRQARLEVGDPGQ